MKHAKGIMWLDDCRIPFVNEGDTTKIDMTKGKVHTSGAMTGGINRVDAGSPLGRFTPNLLVCDNMLNDGVITSQSSGLRKNPGIKTQEWKAGHKKKDIMTTGDKGTNSRYYDLDLWFDKMLEKL